MAITHGNEPKSDREIQNGQDHEHFDNKGKAAGQETSKSATCILCKNVHKLEKCHVFKSKSVRQRNILVRTNRLCLNCLKKGHFVINCNSKLRCHSCQRRHHSLLQKEVEDRESSSPDREKQAIGQAVELAKKETIDNETTANVSGVKITKSCIREGKVTDRRMKISLQVVPVRVYDENGGSNWHLRTIRHW